MAKMIGWVIILILGFALIIAGIEGQVGCLIACFFCPDEINVSLITKGISTTEASFFPAAVNNSRQS